MQSVPLFPYSTIRPVQDAMIKDVQIAVSSGKNLIAHAPTGLGKTAAVLAPALSVALKKNLTVFFLTSRHTQHAIAIETLRLIKEKHKINFSVVDLVGKKDMCARSEVEAFPSRYFHDYCKSLREKDNCDFYLNFRKDNQLSASSKNVLKFINSLPAHTEEVVDSSKKQSVCPYEVASHAAKDASVIIADYNCLFNSRIRESFFGRSSKALNDAVIIVDEAHNLPGRMREMLTARLSTLIIDRAMSEAETWNENDIKTFLASLRYGMEQLATSPELAISKEQLLAAVEGYDLNDILKSMSDLAETVRETEKQSFIGSVADFLLSWMGGDEGFARILTVKESARGKTIVVSNHCLDSSVATKSVIEEAHSVIMMSGTLTPMIMYRDILGFPSDTALKEYGNPLPKENKLSLIVKDATTKFSSRNEQQFMNLADICARAASSVQGNLAIFFPSYFLMSQIHTYLHEKLSKKVFKEHQGMSKSAKQQLLKGFKQESLKGGVLLAVIGGSFSEGINLPGNFLNGVIVVGLPFVQPDLCNKALINYYDKNFGKGWDYGYVFPAFTKALQSAGRCIRSETDKGVIMFVDERYAWTNYYRCFPKDLAPKTTTFYQQAIDEFFGKAKT